MKRVHEEYRADNGKYFVLTSKGKSDCMSFSNDPIGKPVRFWKTYCPAWMIDNGYIIEVDNPNWVEIPGYKVVYDYKGNQLPVGNSYIFPDRQLAENYKVYYQSLPWIYDELYIVDAIYKGELKPCRMYNGKRVYNMDWWFTFDAFVVGDYVEEEIVESVIACLPPTCMRSDCIQLGEPCTARIDENGNAKRTYYTFKKVTKSIYEYCGDCFRGENITRGEEILYV